jgi:hypothetical protein
MTTIRRGHHHIRHPKRDSLCRQNHIAVSRLVISGRLALLTGLRPEHSRLTHRRRGEREVLQESGERVQPRKSTDLVGTQSLTPHFIVGNLRHNDTRPVCH